MNLTFTNTTKLFDTAFNRYVSLAKLSLIIVVIASSSNNTVYANESAEPISQQQFNQELDRSMMLAYEGDKEAQFKVGVLFTNSKFRKPDLEQAVYWYKQAARQGHMLAQYNLGHQYLTGSGVQKSEKQAMQWWLKAAEQGHALAQFNLGRAYYLGIGLDKNIERSKHWFRQAADNNEPKSIDILNKLGWAKNEKLSSTTPSAQSPKVKTSPNQLTEPTKSVQTLKQPTQNNQPKAQVADSKSMIERHQIIEQPLALYTNPAIRSVLITIQDSNHKIEVIKRGKKWTSVRITDGFPVWVHGDFIKTQNDYATLIGDSVNARSVPIITQGTVVGKLNKGEKLLIVDAQGDWYRVISPVRFKAWVKTDNLDQLPKTIITQAVKKSPVTASNYKIKKPSKKVTNKKSSNNQWLFEQPGNYYTLQLGSFDTQEKVQLFLAQTKSLQQNLLKSFKAKGNNIEWTYFLYGSYSSKARAEEVKKEIKQDKALVRVFSKLTQNRCLAWKTQIPTPKALNKYCKN